MNTAELKERAEAATPGPWKASDRSHIYTTDLRVLAVAQHCRETVANAEFIAAANPAAILKLLAINAELVEALKLCAAVCAGETLNKSSLIRALEKSIAVLAKAEGGEL